MSLHSEKAKSLFESGYTCAQSVILAYGDVTHIEDSLALKLMSSFGGGMGRLREVCGAVSGILAVAGVLYGFEKPEQEQKAEHYARVQELALEFRKRNGTFICRELLNLDVLYDTPTPTVRTEDFYKKRKCGEFIASACEILDEYIEKNE